MKKRACKSYTAMYGLHCIRNSLALQGSVTKPALVQHEPQHNQVEESTQMEMCVVSFLSVKTFAVSIPFKTGHFI